MFENERRPVAIQGFLIPLQRHFWEEVLGVGSCQFFTNDTEPATTVDQLQLWGERSWSLQWLPFPAYNNVIWTSQQYV